MFVLISWLSLNLGHCGSKTRSLVIYIDIKSFKNLLVRNHWTDFKRGLFSLYIDIEILKIFFVRNHWNVPLVHHDSSKTWPPEGRAYFSYISIQKTLKVFLSETTRRMSIKCSRNVSLVTLYQDCSCHHESFKNMAARGWDLFSLYIYIENFKKIFLSETTGPTSI